MTNGCKYNHSVSMKAVKQGVSKVNLDQTLAYTKSSFAYKDPYQVNGGLLYKAKNRMVSFFNMRQTENEFHDFKSYKIPTQFSEISKLAFRGFARNDKVLLARSLSEPMFDLVMARLKDKDANPFLKTEEMWHLQCRIYSEADRLLPEEQWSQITVF